jgi:acyl-CoA thioesterase I
LKDVLEFNLQSRQIMEKHLQQPNMRNTLLLVLTVVFICTACSSGGTVNTQHPTAQAQVTQSVSRQQALTGPVVYVAMGASDAVGVGSTQPGSQGYVPLVAEHLPKDSHMVNLGISGIHLHEAISQELPLAISTDPQLITIWLVTNDFVAGVSYDSYMQDLNTLLKQLQTNTQARIVMANLPDITLLPAFDSASADHKSQVKQELQRWNTQIGVIAKSYHVTIVDLSSKDSQLTAHPEYISGDGFHPSPAGYVQLANYFWEAINTHA